MQSRCSTPPKCRRNEQGFTLIEMAVVLIIIGIIIGAVVKGKDLVKGAEQKKLYTSFITAWQLSYNNYYDRTGRILGDTATDNNESSGADTRDGRCNAAATATNLENQLQAAGLEPPQKGATSSTLVRIYTDSEGVQRTLTLAFDYKANLGNFIRVTGLPNDLGIAWDRISDGEMDGQNGTVLYTANHTAAQPTTSAWPSAAIAPVANAAAIIRLQF